MKKIRIKIAALSAMIFLGAFHLSAQEQQKSTSFPNNIALKDLTGKQVLSSVIQNDGKPVIISFWATWCKPCILELSAVNDNYTDWQAETGVKFYAVSIDDSRASSKVPMFVNGKGWEFEVLIDENSDLKRALNVNNMPHTLILDGQGNIIWQHNSYNIGDEEEYIEIVKKHLQNKKGE